MGIRADPTVSKAVAAKKVSLSPGATTKVVPPLLSVAGLVLMAE